MSTLLPWTCTWYARDITCTGHELKSFECIWFVMICSLAFVDFHRQGWNVSSTKHTSRISPRFWRAWTPTMTARVVLNLPCWHCGNTVFRTISNHHFHELTFLLGTSWDLLWIIYSNRPAMSSRLCICSTASWSKQLICWQMLTLSRQAGKKLGVTCSWQARSSTQSS